LSKPSLISLFAFVIIVGCSTTAGVGLQEGRILFISELLVDGDEVVVRKEYPEASVEFTDQNGVELKSNRLRIGDKIFVSDPHFGQVFTLTAINPKKITFRLGESWIFPTGDKGSNRAIVEVVPYSNVVHGR
jgi:hypothetical protein